MIWPGTILQCHVGYVELRREFLGAVGTGDMPAGPLFLRSDRKRGGGAARERLVQSGVRTGRVWIAHASCESSRKTEARNRMVSEPAYRRLYGYALVAIGAGSYFYHASLSFAGQVCDMSGMYLLITFALLYGVARVTRIRTGVAMVTYIVWNRPAGLSDDLTRSATIRICAIGAGGAGLRSKISD